MYRKQMTPGMKKCKDAYGGKKSSPKKYSLEMGAGQAVENTGGNLGDAEFIVNKAGQKVREIGG